MKPQYWHGKKVLITGHTGFKGSWLSLWLESLGATVSGFALPPEQSPALFDVLQLQETINSITGDIRDLKALQSVIDQVNPDVIFHMAAQSLVKPSYDSPVETYQTNVMGTVNLLEAVRQHGKVKAVVVVTSDKCYENHETTWAYKENDRLGGYDPYSNSKACAELVTDAYRNSFLRKTNTAVASVRAGNVIGGGDWSVHRLIPDLIRAKQAGQIMEVRNPEAIRPWQHVLEPLSGYIRVAECLLEKGQKYAEAWNFGPNSDDMKPVRYLVEHAAKKWTDFEWYTEPQPHHHEAATLMLDCSKVRNKLGWLPQWTLDEALTQTFDWYSAYDSGQNMRHVCLSQIAQFSSDVRNNLANKILL